jgi:hypothetical protein
VVANGISRNSASLASPEILNPRRTTSRPLLSRNTPPETVSGPLSKGAWIRHGEGVGRDRDQEPFT